MLLGSIFKRLFWGGGVLMRKGGKINFVKGVYLYNKNKNFLL